LTVHIAIIGETKPAIQTGLLRHGNVTKLFLLHSPNSRKVPFEDIARELAHNLAEVGFENVELREIDAFNMLDVVENIVRIFKEEPNQQYFVNITGGTKITAAAACTAAFIVGARVYYVLHSEEIEPEADPIVQLPIPRIPPSDWIQGTKLEILRLLIERGGIASNSEIREDLRLDGRIFSYHRKELERKGLISSKKGWTFTIHQEGKILSKTDSRALTVELTDAGRLVVNVLL
jgi:CRISPR locus-related DNA-binding protein